MTLPTEYRRQLFYFLGGSGIYAGIISLFYIDYILISPYLTTFILAIAIAATLAPIRRIVHHYIHVIHDTPYKQRINYIFLSLTTLIFLTAILHLPFHLNVSHYIIISLIGVLITCLFTLPSVMDRDILTAIFMLSTITVIILSIIVLVGNALVYETQLAIQYTSNIVELNKDTIERLKDKDSVMVDALHYCESGANYLLSLHLPEQIYSSIQLDQLSTTEFCSKHITFIRDNTQTYIEKARELASEHAGTAGTHVLGIVSSITGSIVSLPMQSIIFFLLLFYFIQYEPRIRAEIWKLSPFSSDETAALVHAINEKVSKTIGQSILKSMGGFWCTYLAFYSAGFHIKLIFAFIAGALELTPFTSPFLIWIPSLILSVAINGIYSYRTPIMLIFYLIDLLVINAQIDKLLDISEQNPTIMSMSVLLGAAAFGPIGVVLSPIVSGMSLVILDMYKKYSLGSHDAINKTVESQKPNKSIESFIEEYTPDINKNNNNNSINDNKLESNHKIIDQSLSDTTTEQKARNVDHIHQTTNTNTAATVKPVSDPIHSNTTR